MSTPPAIEGWSHVVLSVTDLERSVAWYRETLGMAELFGFSTDGFERRLVGHSSGVVLALTQHRATASDDGFDPCRVGLDHVGLRVADVAALESWVAHLDALGRDHAGVQVDEALGSALVATHDPDGIQVELYVQTGAPRG